MNSLVNLDVLREQFRGTARFFYKKSDPSQGDV